ncbi:MAG: lipopolysaccharide biosynthesis protein [Actinomycetota bacterium]
MKTEDAARSAPRKGLVGRAVSRVASDGSLTKKASLNAAASTAEQAARIVAGLIISPILLRELGDTVFGIWQVLQKLIGHTSPASGRPGEALKWTIAHEQGSTDYDFKRRQVGNALAVWLLFLPLLLAIGGVLAWFSPTWLDVGPSSYGTVRLAAGILVLDAVLFSLLYLPQSVLQGENLGYKRLGLSVVLVFVSKGLLVTAVYLGTGIGGLAVATAVATMLWGVTYLFIVRSRVSWFGVARPSVAEVKRFVGLSWWFLVWNLIMTVMLASDVVLLGVVGSPALVTTYTLAKYIPQAITVAVATVIVAIMPGLGGLVGAGELARAVRIRRETISLIWLFTIVSGATTLLWEESFLQLWVGVGYYPGAMAILMVMLMVLQFALIRTDANIIDLTLDLRRKVVLGTVSTVLAVGLAWLFLGPLDMGIIGLVLGFILGRAVQSVGYPWMIGRLLGIPPAQQLRGIARPALATAVLFGAGTALSVELQAGSWPALVLYVGATAALVTVVAFFLGLAPEVRHILWHRLRKVVRLT